MYMFVIRFFLFILSHISTTLYTIMVVLLYVALLLKYSSYLLFHYKLVSE
jgi:hypothetical protein